MLVNNLQMRTCPFDEYLQLPGWSYSGIRNAESVIVATEKMRLGTQVHDYLLTPGNISAEQHPLIRPLAKALAYKLGPLLRYLRPECAVTANFIHAGFNMQYKGRIDLCIPKRIVVDIKISELKDIFSGMSFFGYDRQLNGYAAAIEAKTILLLSINPKTFTTQLINIPINHNWWEQEIKKRGTVI